ncbi:hypothetical protein RI367_001973 [Sorochytrium milnesiophthora]
MTRTTNASKQATVLLLPGDGIGPEVTAAAKSILEYVVDQSHRDIRIVELQAGIGGAALDLDAATPLSDEALRTARTADAVFLGAVGGPKWSSECGWTGARPEQGLLKLRKELDLFANIRPIRFPSALCKSRSPIKDHLLRDFDGFVFVRELVSGIYFGQRQEAAAGDEAAFDTMAYTREEIERVGQVALQLCHSGPQTQPLVVVDKANVLATSRLWRHVVSKLASQPEHSDVALSYMLVDSTAMEIVARPYKLNGHVVLTENMFGDILSDEASVLVGSLGVLPSASLGHGHQGLYEPIHGSAPDIAGTNIANPTGAILSVAMMLRHSLGMPDHAAAVERAVQRAMDEGDGDTIGERATQDLGGTATTTQFTARVLHFLSQELPKARRPMTICEKILTHAAINLPPPGQVASGDMICVRVDWTLASELTWKGMEKTYDLLARPPIHDPTRFWLAIDHTVDPSINHMAKPQSLIKASERFAREAKLTDFHGPNQTILHTEFYRQRAQPGQIVIGADSHSCSAGGVGAFAVGLGAADVCLSMCTGQTWLRVPEIVEIRFVGQPPFGIGGKDTILYVLGELKRNTVAFERAVEYTGPGLQYLSCDARFAIANMTTELGGLAGVFAADDTTAAYIGQRTDPQHVLGARYFSADKDAQYAATHIIDLSRVESLVAVYPSPDNVMPVAQVAGTHLDGCFIGACTTAEEDLILAALVLEQGLKRGWTPTVHGRRKVTPGSVVILSKLRKLGLVAVYERAGFEIGAPGCSFCLGIAADVAGEGEVWLSSQNRNFKNRMGKGSIGNLASAATVAASSFDMKICSPRELLDGVDRARFAALCASMDVTPDMMLLSSHPSAIATQAKPSPSKRGVAGVTVSEPAPILATVAASPPRRALTGDCTTAPDQPAIAGRVQIFGDHIDTDQIIPAQFMPGVDDEDLGTHCFEFYRPEFRDRVRDGACIVVAGAGFGSGSSREEAPRAMLGCGVKAVIAKSFAFIYNRNQYNMALLGLVVSDDAFYEQCAEGSDVSIDLTNRTVTLTSTAADESSAVFPFTLGDFEYRLVCEGGVTEMFKKYGKQVFGACMAEVNGVAVSELSAVDSQPPPFIKSTRVAVPEAGCTQNSAALAW